MPCKGSPNSGRPLAGHKCCVQKRCVLLLYESAKWSNIMTAHGVFRISPLKALISGDYAFYLRVFHKLCQ